MNMDESYSLSQKMWAEGIGTFFLVFVGAGTAAMTLVLNHGAPRYTKSDIGIGALGGSADWLTIGLAFAFAIMTMIYVFGHVSGAHINPAVTLSLLIQRLISPIEAVGYWFAQFAGATVGAFAVALVYGRQAWLIGGLGAPGPFPGVPLWQAGAAEVLGTFGLVMGVLGLAVNKHAPSQWAGLIIGLNIAGLIVLLGNVSGAAINPARTIGPIFADWILGGPNLWHIVVVYILAQVLGASMAAWVYPLIAQSRKVKADKSQVVKM